MMKTNSSTRGFTLIELLVVIAIIGILASVVLASLNSARSKGADAAVKSTVNNARAQAELFYDNNGNIYTNVCTDAASGILNMANSADVTNGAALVECWSDANEWVLAAELITTPTIAYCVDYKGWSGTTTLAAITNADNNMDCN